MDLGLNGKVAVVSGGSKGIGLAICRSLAAEGVAVVAAARGEEALETAVVELIAAGATVRGIVADMTVKADVEHVVQTAASDFGRLDIAVSNVYPTHTGGFETTSDEAFRHEFDTIVMSVVHLVRAAVPELKRQGGGRLVNIGGLTMKGPVRGIPLILSDVTRTAVVGLNRSLAAGLGPFGITVNNIGVGFTRTERMRASYEARSRDSGLDWTQLEAARVAELGIPLGRLGTPEEIAATVTFLSSEQGGYVTGQTVVVDGGFTGGLF